MTRSFAASAKLQGFIEDVLRLLPINAIVQRWQMAALQTELNVKVHQATAQVTSRERVWFSKKELLQPLWFQPLRSKPQNTWMTFVQVTPVARRAGEVETSHLPAAMAGYGFGTSSQRLSLEQTWRAHGPILTLESSGETTPGTN